MTNAATYYPSQSVDLLHGGAQLSDLSLLATRARSAALRASRGDELDDLDLLALDRMSTILVEAAGTLEFFESAGTRGMPPSGALTARIDAAIDAAETTAHGDNSSSATAVLTALAQAAKHVAPDATVEAGETKALSDFLERLSTVVAKQLGHVGEERLSF